MRLRLHVPHHVVQIQPPRIGANYAEVSVQSGGRGGNLHTDAWFAMCTYVCAQLRKLKKIADRSGTEHRI